MAELAEQTPWVRGRFDGVRLLPKSILFGRMYEDTEVEAKVLPAGGRVLCIASAGDTARALAARHEQVVAVDINPVQLEYTKERLAGLPARSGTIERVMGALRALFPLVGVSQVTLREFMDLDDPARQLVFWRERIKTKRFELGFKALLSVTGLKTIYAAPFLDNIPPRFGQVMFERLERGFGTFPNRTNPWARALFLGEVPVAGGPAPGNIELVCQDAAGYLEGQPAGSFVGFTFSNILDGAAPSYMERLYAAAARAAAPGAVLVLRSFGEPGPQVRENHAHEDRSMLWGVVEARNAKS